MPVVRERRFLRVKIDMVTRCQLRCVMCHFAHPDFVENPVTMGGELLEKVAAELFPRAHDVVLSSSAEPLLAPDLPHALELCKKYGVPNFHFSTNALAMTDAIMDKVIDSGMPLITVSSDGITKETFEKIRKPAKWEPFLRRFEVINESKKRRGSTTPAISVTCVLMRSNIREVPQMIRFWHDRGVKYMNFVHMAVIGGLGIESESLMNDAKLCNDTMAEARRVAAEVGMEVMMPIPIAETFANEGQVVDQKRSDEGGGLALIAPSANLHEIADSKEVADYLNHKNREFLLKVGDKRYHNRPCYFPWYYIHVNPDGTVFPCGCWFEFTTFGDFKTQTFREIWTGPKYKELRRQLYHMELRDVCANCSVANMGRPDVKASFSHRAKVRREQRV
ncbi:MAG TPA: radical SAM protein [Planctomycetota bacterium]|nr:radical SAM protein [Planctomycetota bacterium]